MNKFCKVLIPFILVMSLLLASVPVFAAEDATETKANSESPSVKVIVRMEISSRTYNGTNQRPKVKVYDKEGNKVPSDGYMLYAIEVSGSGASSNAGTNKWPKSAGTYKVTIKGRNGYTGMVSAKYVIKKAKNPFKIKIGKTEFKRNKAKNQSTTIKVTGVKGKAKLTKWSSTSPKVYVKGGKVIIKKGFYGSATLSISTKATKNYKKTTKKVTISVKK